MLNQINQRIKVYHDLDLYKIQLLSELISASATGEEWMMMVIVLHVHGEVGGMHPEDDGGALLVVMQCSLQVVDSN